MVFLATFTTNQVNLASSLCQLCREYGKVAICLKWCPKPWLFLQAVMRENSDHREYGRTPSLYKHLFLNLCILKESMIPLIV